MCRSQLLDIGRHMHGLQRFEPMQSDPLGPAEEIRHRPQVRCSRVGIADVGGEEFDKPAGRLIAGRGDRRRQNGVGSADDNKRGFHANIITYFGQK